MTIAKRLLLPVLLLAAGAASVFSQGGPLSTTRIDWNNGSAAQSQFFFRDQNGVLLPEGPDATNSDGALVQLGYFSAASSANNFTGTWMPLTGFGPAGRTTIGDSANPTGRGDGRIGFNTTFHWGTTNGDVYDPATAEPGKAYITQSSVQFSDTLPPNGQVLSIRFYDSTDSSGKYNTVSSDTWLWQSPTDVGQVVLISIPNSTLEWESVSVFGLTGTEFRTVIAIPEPSTFALFGVGALSFVGMLRRRAKR